MRLSLRISLAAVLSIAACKDGPEQIFLPNSGNPTEQNGYKPTDPWVQPGTKPYDDDSTSTGDSKGRAKFCDEADNADVVREMVVAPIVPDVGLGLLPLLKSDGTQVHADDLIGSREQGRFCDPTIYADALTWGPTNEVIAWLNVDTRLVEGLMAYEQYLGTLEGTYTFEGRQVPVIVQPRERLKIDGVEMDEYTSSEDQDSKPRAWLNHKNVTAFYKMLRETFFNAPPFPDSFDCVADKICDVIYEGGNEATPQDSFIVIRDTGLQVRFSPEGHAFFVYLEPIRAAPFETEGTIAFGAPASMEMAFRFSSESRLNCQVALDEELTFGEFKSRCIDAGDDRTLQRATYNVDTARDAVDVAFNGINLNFMRKTTVSGVLRDGEHPADGDVLYSVGFTRVLNAPVEEYRPRTLANLYKARLEQRLRDAIIADGPISREMHPLALYNVSNPFIFDSPQSIGELRTTNGNRNWVPLVVADIVALYHSLPQEEQDMVDPRLLEPVFLLEPFVDAVLYAFSHGEVDAPGAFKAFRTTDDRQWSIGFAHFVRGGIPYRVEVQYSLNYGAVSAVFVDRGGSEIDEIFDGLNRKYGGGASPYYSIELASALGNPYGLGGDGITVTGFDRQLGTLTATLTTVLPNGELDSVGMTVTGEPIEDRNGYLRQIRGERWEFIPANVVNLSGKETVVVVYVDADGTIGRVDQGLFKGAVELCPGLGISYGDDVAKAVDVWSRTVQQNDYRDCEIVFNYSQNGNVLDEVASLTNRVKFVVVDGRAVTAAVWR